MLLAEHHDDDGDMVVEEIGPALVYSTFGGRLTLAHAEALIVGATSAIAKYRRNTSFHDWAALKRHDAAARERLTKWTLETRASQCGAHILITLGSPIMGMAVAASNLVLGDMVTVHPTRSSFDEALRRCGVTRPRLAHR